MVTVATWNLENLYRPGGEFGPRTEAAYDKKLQALAATIDRIRPDVLGVQEVGEPGALADLVDRLDGHWLSVLSAFPTAGAFGWGSSAASRSKPAPTSSKCRHCSPGSRPMMVPRS